MKTFVFLGIRVMSDREWTSAVLERASFRELNERLLNRLSRLEAELAAYAENDSVRDDVALHNVTLASRAERAEAEAEALRRQLADALGKA